MAGHQENARAEQHGKNAHEFQVGKELARKPHGIIRSVQIAVDGRIYVCGADHRKRLDIHVQNAQQSESAKRVD
jgi:hypothetical protein